MTAEQTWTSSRSPPIGEYSCRPSDPSRGSTVSADRLRAYQHAFLIVESRSASGTGEPGRMNNKSNHISVLGHDCWLRPGICRLTMS